METTKSRDLQKQIEQINKRTKLELKLIKQVEDNVVKGINKSEKIDELATRLSKIDANTSLIDKSDLVDLVKGLSTTFYSEQMLNALQKLETEKQNEIKTQLTENSTQINNRFLSARGSCEINLKEATEKKRHEVEQINNNLSNNIVLTINNILRATYTDALKPVEKDSTFSEKFNNFFKNNTKNNKKAEELLEGPDGKNEKNSNPLFSSSSRGNRH